jgi:uncharacterized protein
VVYEWSAAKARANVQKHGVSFEEATSAFLDPLAMTFFDPDHSVEEAREITIGHSIRHRVVFVAHCQRGDRTRIISARKATKRERTHMKKARATKQTDDLRPEYNLFELGPMVRGKYYRQAVSGSNLILIEPELARVFPDSESVNRALRLLVKTAEASAAPRRHRTPKKRAQVLR